MANIIKLKPDFVEFSYSLLSDLCTHNVVNGYLTVLLFGGFV